MGQTKATVLLGFTLAGFNLDRVRSFRAKHRLSGSHDSRARQSAAPGRSKRRGGTWTKLLADRPGSGLTRLSARSRYNSDRLRAASARLHVGPTGFCTGCVRLPARPSALFETPRGAPNEHGKPRWLFIASGVS